MHRDRVYPRDRETFTVKNSGSAENLKIEKNSTKQVVGCARRDPL